MRVMVTVAAVTALLTAPAAPVQAATGAQVVARYSFDAGLPGDLIVVVRAGGAVRQVAGVSGLAAGFPARCGAGCARAILQGADRDALDPGVRPIRYGASVRLDPGQTSDGSNVVQKGVWTSGSQWKLQVDGAAGRPSCALMGNGSRRIHRAVAAVSVADGRWHQVTCERSGTTLRVLVDGSVRGQAVVPAGLSVRNDAPLRIGGNGVGWDNDQFHGSVDEVFVAVG